MDINRLRQSYYSTVSSAATFLLDRSYILKSFLGLCLAVILCACVLCRSATAPKRHATIVFFGDGLIAQWHSSIFGGRDLPLNAANEGRGGNTCGDLLSRFDRDVIPHQPSVLLLYCGTNDLCGCGSLAHADGSPGTPMPLTQVESDLLRIIAKAKINGITVVVATLVPRGTIPAEKLRQYNFFLSTLGNRVADFNAALTGSTGAKLVDMFDGEYPTPAAYKSLADVAKSVITSAAVKEH